jgi:argininosuccinate lyase
VDEAAVEYMGRPLGLSEESIRKALNPAKCVKARKLTGGPAPERVEEDIARSRTRYTEDETALAQIRGRLANSESRLEAAIDEIVG